MRPRALTVMPLVAAHSRMAAESPLGVAVWLDRLLELVVDRMRRPLSI